MRPEVKFKVSYGFYSDYLNAIIKNGITLTNIQQTEAGFTACCVAANYHRIARMSRKYQCRVKIIDKSRFVTALKYCRKRKGLFAGAAVFAVLCFLFSRIIWRIEVNVADKTIESEIVAQLLENDIYAGSFFSKDRLYYVQQEIVKKSDRIAYAALNFYRGVLECDIYLRTEREDFTTGESAEDILCALGGTVTEIRVYSGFPAVKAGQSVSPGDVLVSNTETDKYNIVSSMHTSAYVEGLCRKDYSVFIPFSRQADVYTAETEKEITLYTPFGVHNCIKAELSGWKNYTVNTSVTYVSLMGFRLPVTVRTRNFYRKENITFSSDLLSAQSAAQTHIQHLIMRDTKLKKELNRSAEYTVTDDGIQIFCTVEGYYDMT